MTNIYLLNYNLWKGCHNINNGEGARGVHLDLVFLNLFVVLLHQAECKHVV